jgi:ribosomal protein S14
MKLSANKDKKLRKKLSQLELEERQYRYLRVNVLNLPYYKQDRNVYKHYFNARLRKRISKTKLVRRCLLTYKARVMYKKFKISRVKLKYMLDLNLIAGYKKAVW